MDAKTKELEENMRKFQTSLKDVEWTSRIEYCWQILTECIEENERALDMFEKKWEALILKRIRELDEWRSRHYN